MESLFSKYPYALFFIAGFFMLIENRDIKKTINSNIVILFIIFSITSIFSVGSFWKNSLVILVLTFIELEILSTTEDRDKLIVSAKYKLQDFIFTSINKYKMLSMLLINFLFYMSNIWSDINTFWWLIYILIISGLFLGNIGRIYKNEFNTKTLDKIEKDYINATIGYKDPRKNKNLKKKIELLLEIEDRTFEHRKSSHTILCWESLVYKLNKDYDTIDKINTINSYKIQYKLRFIRYNFKKIINLSYRIFVVLIKAIFSKQGLRRYLNRGYSTIEMQLIRTYGVVSGYEKTYIRKIYELIYANIFFKSYYRKSNYYHYLEEDEEIKYRIPYAYLNSVRTFINGKIFKNIRGYYKYIRNIPRGQKLSKGEENHIVYNLSIEEIFIFILGLSKKKINNDIMIKYSHYIEKYDLNVNKLEVIINKCNC